MEQIESQQEKSENPVEFNNRKRKMLGDGIQDSFLHPKPFKVEKMTLPSTSKSSENKREDKKVVPSKKLNLPKHRFNVI
jgi:hypothetical protein